jgi:hypothetical protein
MKGKERKEGLKWEKERGEMWLVGWLVYLNIR